MLSCLLGPLLSSGSREASEARRKRLQVASEASEAAVIRENLSQVKADKAKAEADQAKADNKYQAKATNNYQAKATNKNQAKANNE
jgi:hypothetical protein